MITRERVARRTVWPPAIDRDDVAGAPVPDDRSAPDTDSAEKGSRCTGARYLLTKRMIDVPVALAMLILASPVMLAVALLIRLRSPGPILFAHRRLGRNGRPFACLKFRTMHVDAEKRLRADPAMWAEFVANGYKLKPDPRVIPLGGFLRKSSIDELPQLLNVLRGEMSLVGPRPIIEPELVEYGPDADLFLSALPGMTGRWQADPKGQVPYPDRTEVELGYIRSWSVTQDFVILCRTIPVVLKAGASRLVRR